MCDNTEKLLLVSFCSDAFYASAQSPGGSIDCPAMASSSSAAPGDAPAPKSKKRRGVQQRRRQRFEKEGLTGVKDALALAVAEDDTTALEECIEEAAAHIARAGVRESAVKASREYEDCCDQLSRAQEALCQRRAQSGLVAEVEAGTDQGALQQAIAHAQEVGLTDIAEDAAQFAKYWFGEAEVTAGIPDSEENPWMDEEEVPAVPAEAPAVGTSVEGSLAPDAACVLSNFPIDGLGLEGREPLVCVFGLMKSGTKALSAYIRKHFVAQVTPASGKHPVDGQVTVDHKLWKHHVPMSPIALPEMYAGRPVCVLICVREIRSWMAALSEGAYTILRAEGGRRKKYNIEWMLRAITIRDEVTNEVRRFDSVVELYTTYMESYFGGNLSTSRAKTIVIKYEDILADPKGVVERLEYIGLCRKSVFEAIDENIGSSGRSRSALIEGRGQISKRFSHEQLTCIGHSLTPCLGHLRMLGYA